MDNKLRQHFDSVRREYFPRWDKNREWKVRSVAYIALATGECVRETKTIKIKRPHPDGDELTELLIHEIAHAVTKGGHGKTWESRMKKAAVRAAEIGQHNVRKLLMEDLARRFIEDPSRERRDMYQRIDDIVSTWDFDSPCITFSQEVVSRIRWESGEEYDEFLTNYPRAREAYDGGVRNRDLLMRQYAEVYGYQTEAGVDT